MKNYIGLVIVILVIALIILVAFKAKNYSSPSTDVYENLEDDGNPEIDQIDVFNSD